MKSITQWDHGTACTKAHGDTAISMSCVLVYEDSVADQNSNSSRCQVGRPEELVKRSSSSRAHSHTQATSAMMEEI